MILLTDASKQFKEQLIQNLDLRVRLYKGRANGTALTTVFANPVVTLPAGCFVHSVMVTHASGVGDIQLQYSHDGVTFQAWHVAAGVASGDTIVPPTPVWCEYVKVVRLTAAGAEANLTSPTVTVYEEDWFDLSHHVRDGVTVERTMDRELGVYTMQHASVPLDNSLRYFSKRNSASPFWDTARGVHYCRANAKFLIEVMYRGNDGRIPETGDGRPEWIPLVTFFAQSFGSNPEVMLVTASGSAGKILLKSKTTQPLFELMTPVELIRDGILRSDDDNSLLMPINPGARQKTESAYNEYVGQAKTFADNWWDEVSFDYLSLGAVVHPGLGNDQPSGGYLIAHTPDGEFRRFGMCSDGSFVYMLLFQRQGVLDAWWIEKRSFGGDLLQSFVVDYFPGAGNRYLQDLCVDDTYFYLSFNSGVTRNQGRMVRRKKDFSDGWTDLVVASSSSVASEVLGVAWFADSPQFVGPALVFFVRRWNVDDTYLGDYLYWHELGSGITLPVQIATVTTFGFQFLEAIDPGRILGHAVNLNTVLAWSTADVLTWNSSYVTYGLILADTPGAMFSDHRKFVYMFRHNIGFGKVVEFGFWLENGNIQYAGATGFDGTINFPQPEIRRDGQLLDRSGTVSAGLLTTDDYALNLATGELQTLGLPPDGSRFNATYDYKYSLQYVRIEKQNRLEALSDISISNNFVVYANATNELQFRDRRYEELIVCSDGTTAVTNKRLGDTYQAGGMPYIVHDSNSIYAPFKTVIVCGADRVRKFIEGVDFMIAYVSGRHFITFLGTEKVHESKSAVVRYHVQQEIPVLKDVKHIVQGGVDEQWGDEKLINDVTVTGEKMLPQDTSISAEQIFAVSPNEDKQSSRYANFQENVPEGLFNWNPATKVVDDDSLPDAQRKYLIEFDSPLVLGTTGFDVVYGDARNGGDGAGEGQYGILISGVQAHNGSTSSARFYKITFGSGGTFLAKDLLYRVMVDDKREWRLATAADYDDMLGNSGGFDPANPADVKTTDHFYLKQMNGNYGQHAVNYIAYYTRTVRYYMDRHGRIIEDATYTPNDPDKNPVRTVSPQKRIAITLTPEDERQCPLFPLHTSAGKPGYYGTETPPAGFNYWTGVLREFSLRISRLEADMLGVNFDYDSWSAVTNFVRVATTGFPLTVIERFIGRAPASPEDLELYGLRDKSIDNTNVQNIAAARNLARSIKSLRGNESEEFSVEVLHDASLTIETLVRVIETFSGIDELFTIVSMSDKLNVSSPSTMRLGLEDVETQ